MLAPDGVDFGRVLVIGVGKADAADGLAVERWAGHAVKRVLTSAPKSSCCSPTRCRACRRPKPARMPPWARGLAAYRFDTYRTKLKPEQKPSLTTVEIAMDGTRRRQGAC
jgi:leucyl aminopeptidase